MAEPVPGGPLELELRDVTAGYGAKLVIRGISLAVPAGGVLALLGPNGAGKTTIMRTAAGLIRPAQGAVLVRDESVNSIGPAARVARGLCLIPEGRGIFAGLSVEDNLRLFASAGLSRPAEKEAADRAYTQFPILRERAKQTAGRLSGGQQQMLALSRAYMTNPRCILIDEISIGLAPVVVDEVYIAIRGLAASGTALVIVEQYVHRALALADSVALIQKGQITFAGPPEQVDESLLAESYLGATS